MRAKADLIGINAGIAAVEPSRIAFFALQAQNASPTGEDRYVHEFLPDVELGDELAAPTLGRSGATVVTQAVAVLATLPPEQRYPGRVVSETGFAVATVGRIFEELTDAGLLVSAGKSQLKVSGPRPNLFSATEHFDHYLQGVPEWRRAYNLRVMAERLGRVEAGRLGYLLTIGQASVLASQATHATQ